MKYLAIIAAVALLSACGHNPLVPETKIVKVKVPVPFCPAPPVIPECTKYTDALTSADAKDPGKVAQLTKLELACLRAEAVSLRQTVRSYKDVSSMAAEVERSLDEAASQLTPPAQPDTHK